MRAAGENERERSARPGGVDNGNGGLFFGFVGIWVLNLGGFEWVGLFGGFGFLNTPFPGSVFGYYGLVGLGLIWDRLGWFGFISVGLDGM